MLQAKPNRCLIETDGVPDVIQALECGWFDAVTSGSLDTQLNVFGHDVMAAVARYRLQYGQPAKAETILFRGSTAGTVIEGCTGARLYTHVCHTVLHLTKISSSTWHENDMPCQTNPKVTGAVTGLRVHFPVQTTTLL